MRDNPHTNAYVLVEMASHTPLELVTYFFDIAFGVLLLIQGIVLLIDLDSVADFIVSLFVMYVRVAVFVLISTQLRGRIRLCL